MSAVPAWKIRSITALALCVLRVGFARVHDLHWSDGGGNATQTIGVTDKKIRPLVCCRASRESERQRMHVETRVRLAVDVLDQRALRLRVRLRNLRLRDVDGIPQSLIVLLPPGNMPIESA